jgi:hypothetical protein
MDNWTRELREITGLSIAVGDHLIAHEETQIPESCFGRGKLSQTLAGSHLLEHLECVVVMESPTGSRGIPHTQQ